jgi:hypothetical protein
MALSSANSRSIQLSYRSFGVPGRIRTCDPKFRKLVFYPTELRAQLAEHTGFEPVVFAVTGRRVNRYTNAPWVVEDRRVELLTHPCHGCVIPLHQSPKYTIACKTIEFFGDNGNIGMFGLYGAASRIRTADLLITNQLLYQLS